MTGEALRRQRRHMQIIFQDPYSSLNPRLRAGEIVRAPLDQLDVGDRESRDDRVAELFRLVGLRPEQQALSRTSSPAASASASAWRARWRPSRT